MLSDSQGIEDDSILAGLFYCFNWKKKNLYIFLYLADVKQTDDEELLDNEM